jgi:hypothetical protein
MWSSCASLWILLAFCNAAWSKRKLARRRGSRAGGSLCAILRYRANSTVELWLFLCEKDSYYLTQYKCTLLEQLTVNKSKLKN